MARFKNCPKGNKSWNVLESTILPSMLNGGSEHNQNSSVQHPPISSWILVNTLVVNSRLHPRSLPKWPSFSWFSFWTVVSGVKISRFLSPSQKHTPPGWRVSDLRFSKVSLGRRGLRMVSGRPDFFSVIFRDWYCFFLERKSMKTFKETAGMNKHDCFWISRVQQMYIHMLRYDLPVSNFIMFARHFEKESDAQIAMAI